MVALIFQLLSISNLLKIVVKNILKAMFIHSYLLFFYVHQKEFWRMRYDHGLRERI